MCERRCDNDSVLRVAMMFWQPHCHRGNFGGYWKQTKPEPSSAFSNHGSISQGSTIRPCLANQATSKQLIADTAKNHSTQSASLLLVRVFRCLRSPTTAKYAYPEQSFRQIPKLHRSTVKYIPNDFGFARNIRMRTTTNVGRYNAVGNDEKNGFKLLVGRQPRHLH